MYNFGVYQIELNGKRYIGSTIARFSTRWGAHLHNLRRGIHCNAHLQNAFNKYGEDALRFSVIETVETPEECLILEQKYIDELKPEYNICQIAGNCRGVKHTEETRRKMSKHKNHLGFKLSEEVKQKLREANLGRVMSEETKRKISEANKGHIAPPMSEETKKKISEAGRGKQMLEATRQGIRKANLGRARSEETKKKIGEANARKYSSEEFRQKMSEVKKGNTNMLGHKHSEETKKKMSEALKGREFSGETKQKMRDAQKRRWQHKREMAVK